MDLEDAGDLLFNNPNGHKSPEGKQQEDFDEEHMLDIFTDECESDDDLFNTGNDDESWDTDGECNLHCVDIEKTTDSLQLPLTSTDDLNAPDDGLPMQGNSDCPSGALIQSENGCKPQHRNR